MSAPPPTYGAPPPLPPGWEEKFAPDGRPYYENHVTGGADAQGRGGWTTPYLRLYLPRAHSAGPSESGGWEDRAPGARAG